MYQDAQNPRKHHLEVRVRDIVDRVVEGRPIEDDTVELKAEWPHDANKAARRIAGHANAAGGVPILWLIGVDEKGKSVIGAPSTEIATWYPRVKAEFSELAPYLLAHLNVPIEDKDVIALLFETDRAPYVVKNPCFNQQGGGPVQFEVPWRQGTRIQTATRGDLLRILSPKSGLPTVDLLRGSLKLSPCRNEPHVHWHLELHVYVGLSNDIPLLIPAHLCWAEFEIPQSLQWTAFSHLEFYRLEAGSDTRGRHRGSPTINASPHELIINGPGAAELRANVHTPVIEEPETDAHVELGLAPYGTELTRRVSLTLTRVVPRPSTEGPGVTVWEYNQERAKRPG